MNQRIVKHKKYNPAFLSDEELINSFVVRHTELELIMQTISENITESNQHIMIIGQRGIGKTMLVLRAATEVRKNKELMDKWYPLVFAEESYQVSTPGEFWLEALFHLGQQEKSIQWKQTFRELREEDNEDRLRERALAQLMDFADNQCKRILIIVENFNMLLGDQISDDDAWKLRHTLLNEPRIMLLATATSRFKEIESADKAMFELFKIRELKPLNEGECRTIWASITGKELHDERIRPIQILTGGNPRLIRILSSFGASMSFKELMDDLIQLVDDHTEYFKSYLDRLAPTERKVYLSLAELWVPSTASEVAKAARLNVSKTSALLGRLMERGAVVVSKEKGRKKWYQVAERMYNIYYLMRRRGAPSRRIRGVVNFMVNFYRQEELVRITGKLAEEACKLDAQLRRDHYIAYENIFETISSRVFREKILDITPKSFFEMDDTPKSIRSLIEREKPTKMTQEEEELSALLEQADELSKKPDKLKEAESIYRKAIEIAPNKAISWLRLGGLLHEKLERYEEAEKAYRKAIELNEKFVPTWALLGSLLEEKLERYDEAEKAYRKAIELDEKYAWVWVLLGLLLHEKLERYDEAEKAYRKAIEIDEKFAWAWVNLGALLHKKLERYDEAENAYRKAIELDEKYAWVWALLGRLLEEKLERYDEAEKAYRKAIELDEKYVWAWANLGLLLHEKLERYDEAEKAYRKIIELDEKFAWAWVSLGLLLEEKLERYDEAENAYRKAIELNEKHDLTWALLGRLFHEKLERYDEAEKAYRKAIELNEKHDWAWVLLGRLFHEKLERYEEAGKAYRKAVELGIYSADIWIGLIQLEIRKTNNVRDVFALAEQCVASQPQNAELLNVIAWAFFKHGSGQFLKQAEEWAREAVRLAPDHTGVQGTLTSILSAKGKGAEALEHASKFLEDRELVDVYLEDTIEQFVDLAAHGYAKEALEVLANSASAKILEPLVVGLRLFVGEDVNTAVEIMEVGKDVVKRIVKRQEEIRAENKKGKEIE